MISEISLTTPALIFPAISLLMVAYTNRFNVITSRVRGMIEAFKAVPSHSLMAQINSLKARLYIIRNMQAFGISSLFICVLCMFAIMAEWVLLSKWLFVTSLIFMLLSLSYSLYEIVISVNAMRLELNDLDISSKRD